MKRLILLLVVSSLCGALAGAAAGFATSLYIPETTVPAVRVTTTSTTPTQHTPTSTFSLVPLERRAVVSLVPPAFLKRRSSAVATLYHKPKGTVLEDRFLSEDRMLGQAVALTSDGWFVTSASVFEGLRTADVTLWYRGRGYVVEKAVLDHLSSVVFLKTSATDLVPSAFAYVQDLQPGAELWLETRTGELAPSGVLSVNGRTTAEAVASETISRRIMATGESLTGDRGGAAWDPNGSLVGIIDSAPNTRTRIIPASGIASSFSSLLANGNIRHAQLGVRSIDLADVRVDGDRGELPTSGALVRAVTRDLAAAKVKIKIGDVILRVDRDILDGSADLGEVLAYYQQGTLVTLRILREGVDMDVPVTLGQVMTSEEIK